MPGLVGQGGEQEQRRLLKRSLSHAAYIYQRPTYTVDRFIVLPPGIPIRCLGAPAVVAARQQAEIAQCSIAHRAAGRLHLDGAGAARRCCRVPGTQARVTAFGGMPAADTGGLGEGGQERARPG
ncbi:hypothetical protein GCM10010216_21010 [Streptomyces flaveolus]|nr:hypothetical protein GCM10010216_21010 [Streptomyces flaveolus]